MVRCDDFYRKWQEEGNFCEKSPEAAREIYEYLEFRRESGIPEISQHASRFLIREKDSQIRDLAIFFICSADKKSREASGKGLVPTEAVVKEFLTKARKQIAAEAEREVKRIEEEAEAAVKKIEESFPEVPSHPGATVVEREILEVAKKSESASDGDPGEQDLRNKPKVPLTKFNEDLKKAGAEEGFRIAPQNSLKESYTVQVVGTVKIPQVPQDAPTRDAVEKLVADIKTAKECVDELKVKDGDLILLRREVQAEVESLQAQISELTSKLNERKARVKGIDRERQIIGLDIIDQGKRIADLTKQVEEV